MPAENAAVCFLSKTIRGRRNLSTFSRSLGLIYRQGTVRVTHSWSWEAGKIRQKQGGAGGSKNVRVGHRRRGRSSPGRRDPRWWDQARWRGPKRTSCEEPRRRRWERQQCRVRLYGGATTETAPTTQGTGTRPLKAHFLLTFVCFSATTWLLPLIHYSTVNILCILLAFLSFPPPNLTFPLPDKTKKMEM